jgi:hypothetical protein
MVFRGVIIDASILKAVCSAKNQFVKKILIIGMGCRMGVLYGDSIAGILDGSQFFLAGADNSLWNGWFFQNGICGHWCHNHIRCHGREDTT